MRSIIIFLVLVGLSLAKPVIFGNKGIAIGGYDTVAYFTQKKAVKGKARFAHRYRKATWYFSSAANLRRFKKNPKKYAPLYGGYCAYAMATSGKKVKIDPTAFSVHKGRLYLNYNDKIQKKWLQQVDTYIKQANKNYRP